MINQSDIYINWGVDTSTSIPELKYLIAIGDIRSWSNNNQHYWEDSARNPRYLGNYATITNTDPEDLVNPW